MQKVLHHLSLNNREIINACRTLAYIRGIPPAPAVWPSTEPRPDKGWMTDGNCCTNDGGYYTWPAGTASPPEQFGGAWWYDSDIPASAEFFGFLPTSIEVTTPFARTRGSDFRVGQERRTKRSIIIEGDIVSASCAGTDYGREVLMQAFLDECSGRMSCEGSELLLKRHEICYTDPAPSPLVGDPFRIYAQDSFNRADSSTLGPVERGDGYTWTQTGSPGIVSNEVSIPGSGGISIADFEHPDVAISVRWMGGGVLELRARNTAIKLDTNGGQLRLLDAVDAVVGSAAYTPTVGDRIELVVRGDEAAGLVNGVEVVTGPATSTSTDQTVSVNAPALAVQVDDFVANAVVPATDDGSRTMRDVYLVSFEDTTPDEGYPCCQGAKLTIVLEAETPWMFDTRVESCWNQRTWDLVNSYCPPMKVVDADVEPPVPTQPVEVTRRRKKRRLAIEVRRDGTWCAIGWNQSTADGSMHYWLPTFTDFEGVDFDEPDDENDYVRLTYDSTTGSFTWSPLTFSGNFQSCDKPTRVAQVSHRQQRSSEAEDPGATPPMVVSGVGGSYFLDVQLNIDYSVTPLGWNPADAFPSPQANYRIVNQCPEPAIQVTDEPPCGEGECKIEINDNGTWTAKGWNHDPLQAFPPTQDDTGCTGIVVDQSDDLIVETITVQAPIDACVTVPPEMAPFLPPAPPLPASVSAYCAPFQLSPLTCIVQTGVSWIDQVLDVSVFSGTSDMRNCAIQVYPYDPTQDPATPTGLDFYLSQDPVWYRRIGYIPAGAIWSYFGRSGRSILDCGDGAPRSGEAGAWDPNNTSHPVLQCDDDFVVIATADVANTATDAWISAAAIRRELT